MRYRNYVDPDPYSEYGSESTQLKIRKNAGLTDKNSPSQKNAEPFSCAIIFEYRYFFVAKNLHNVSSTNPSNPVDKKN